MKQFDLKTAYILAAGRNGPVQCPVILPEALRRISDQVDGATLRAAVAKALGGTRPEDLTVTYGNAVGVENGSIVRTPIVRVHRNDMSGAAVWQLAA